MGNNREKSFQRLSFMGNAQALGGHEVDDRGLPLRDNNNGGGSAWDTALCVCPGERRDLKIMGVGIAGCKSARNVELRRLDEQLLLSCTLGKAEEIPKLLAEGADVHAMRQPEGKTGLHLAAHAGALDVVKALIQGH